MALPAVRAVGTEGASITGTTPGLPAGTALNDILVLVVEMNDVGTFDPTGIGYAHAPDSPVTQTAGAGTILTVCWKRAGSSESAPSIPDAGDHVLARIVGITGCPTSGSPWDVTAQGITGAATTSASIPGDTTTGPDRLVLAVFSAVVDGLSTPQITTFANASLANVSERMDNWTALGDGGGIWMLSGEKATQGAYSATTATTPSSQMAYWSGALKPAAATLERSAAIGATAAVTAASQFVSTIPARAFDGTGDALSTSIGACNLTGAFTQAVLIRRTESGAARFMGNFTSAPAAALQIGTNASNLITCLGSSTRTGATTITAADGWVLAVVTKAAGTATPRAHTFKAGSWTHENTSGTINDPTSQAGGSIQFATDLLGFYAVDIALAAEWTSELSDGDVEALATGTHAGAWAAKNPQGLWQFHRAVATAVVDETGNGADQAGITGTTLSEDGPRTWNFLTTHSRSATIASVAATASSPQRELLRAAALAATGSISSTAIFLSILDRAGTLTAVVAFVTEGERDLLRSAAIAATAAITAAGQVEGGAVTHERFASLAATGSLTAAGQRDLLRSASLGASGEITAAPQRALLRSASLAVLAGIAADGQIQGAHTRSASFTASATISTSPQRDLSRFAALLATAALDTTPERELLRSAALSASGEIAASGIAAAVYERAAALEALAAVTAEDSETGRFRWASQTDSEWITIPDV